jgi:hypothetical protein
LKLSDALGAREGFDTLVGSQTYQPKEGIEMPGNTSHDALAESVRAVERQMDHYISFTELERAQAEIARLRQELNEKDIEVPDIDLDLDIEWMTQARMKSGMALPKKT